MKVIDLPESPEPVLRVWVGDQGDGHKLAGEDHDLRVFTMSSLFALAVVASFALGCSIGYYFGARHESPRPDAQAARPDRP